MSGLGGVLLFLAGAALIWWVFGRGNPAGEAALELVREGALILDVRTPVEFAAGHVRGARNVPVDQLGVRLAELGDPGPVVVYCATGARSARATSVLKAAGFDVVDVGRFSAFPPEMRQEP